MPDVSRRQFLATSAATLSAASYLRAGDAPNDKIRLAVMGVRSRGKQLLGYLSKLDGFEIAYLVDVDENVIPDAMKVVKQPTPPKVEKDVRKALADKSVTALVVAAPDHWHALATMWGLQHDKHVYVEKPVSHDLAEGSALVAATRKAKKVVQVGTQRRSADHVIAAKEYIAAGKLGKVAFARAAIAGSRKPIGKLENSPVPKGVDYDLWLGPAKAREFNKNHFHYNWHWFWEYGTGEIGNNGIHGLDVARYVLGLDAPTRITSAGGKYIFDDDQQTPDTQIATFEFPGCTLAWEHRTWDRVTIEGESFSVALHGEKGTMYFTKKGWVVKAGKDGTEVVDSLKHADAMEVAHLKNFFDAIRGEKKLNAEVEEGHNSTRLCHLGNIAFRTGHAIKFDAKTETLVDDADANKLLGREYRAGFELPKI